MPALLATLNPKPETPKPKSQSNNVMPALLPTLTAPTTILLSGYNSLQKEWGRPEYNQTLY
jgi:hypothetical protein